MTTLTVRIKHIEQQALDVKSFLLVSTDDQPLPAFSAGSHIDVHIGNGITRQYSLCNGPDERDAYLIAVKREPASRGGSARMHEMQEGDVLTIGAPRNNFALDASASHHVLLAGGIGITPLLSMARQLQADHASFELHYFARSEQHAAFRNLLSAAELSSHVRFHHGLQPDAMQRHLQDFLASRPGGAHLYLCGPRPFMDMVTTCAAAAWPAGTVHLEYFAAAPEDSAGPQDAFRIHLARSGESYEVPQGKSIISILAAHGHALETSCEQGVCGTCLTTVLEGVPDHRDVFLSDAEKAACNKILPCVSRAKSPLLVLDL